MAQDQVRPFHVVVIGGSAGSLEIVMDIVRNLPPQSQDVFIIVLHRKYDNNESILENLLSHNTKLRVMEVEDKEIIQPASIYIAAPDYHLLVESDGASFSLDSSEKVHYSRPSINVTFQSVADVFGNRVLGILLSGANADGAEGLLAIKQAGGHTMVQHPATAEVDFMPQQAINMGADMDVIEANLLSNAVNDFLRRL